MRARRICRSVITIITFVLTLSSAALIALPQQGGTAAKGGSLSIERPVKQRRSNLKTLAAYYRPIVRLLDLNFSELAEEYEAARKTNPDLKFETVIIAYVAAERHSSETRIEDGKKVVEALNPAHNNLALALQQVFSLSEEQARDEARAAVAQYKEAERQATHP